MSVVEESAGALDKYLNSARPVAGRLRTSALGGLRFAFYGRTSTEDFQDPVSSRAWQLESAECVVAGRGVIVAEFFDVGCSRRVAWCDRPGASALLAELTGGSRRFDAVVVGEFERAFAAGQFDDVANLLAAHGVGVWLPEAGGPVEVGSVMHRALMTLLGAQSQREVVRARQRAMTAMRRQVVEQGRYLGGRAPYGYKLVDAGPHPNRVHARWGRRLRKFAPDPTTARNVRWMFAQRVAGRSAASIARELTGRRVQTPSGRHGAAGEWSERTVIEILRNPRYTGRQVWNRTSTDRSQRAAGADRFAQDRNGMGKWVVSAVVAHPALVSEEDFVAAQSARVVRTAMDGNVHIYRYVGLLQCGECGRRMDAHRVHGRPGYRCRHGHRSSRTRPADAPSSLYWREDHLTVAIMDRLKRRGYGIGEDLDEMEAFLRARTAIVNCHRDKVTVGLRRCGRRAAATNQTTGRSRRYGRRRNLMVDSKPHGRHPS